MTTDIIDILSCKARVSQNSPIIQAYFVLAEQLMDVKLWDGPSMMAQLPLVEEVRWLSEKTVFAPFELHCHSPPTFSAPVNSSIEEAIQKNTKR